MSIRRVLIILIAIESAYSMFYNNSSSELINNKVMSTRNLERVKTHLQLSNISLNLTKRAAVELKQNHKKKSKRKTTKLVTNCKKLDFHVDFIELGWNKWIIFPKTFNAHICSGDCSLKFTNQKQLASSAASRAHLAHVTNHAQIMSILQMKHSLSRKQISKCVSTKLKPLTVVFLDDNGFIKTKTYDDMIVDECGCR